MQKSTPTSVAALCAAILYLFLFSAPAVYGAQPGVDDSLDIMIGQMLMIGFRGTAVSDTSPVLRHIRETHVGGVVLFDYDVERKSGVRNIESPAQLRRLTASLQAAARIPLFIAIDQEGGRVARLKPKHGFPPTISQQMLGDLNSADSTSAAARSMAAVLRGCGITVNFSPVLDLNTNPANPVIGGLGRSFGADPALVAKHGRIMAAEYRAAGIRSAIKHFPGHGSSRSDSHEGFVDVSGTWAHVELAPFADLIRARACDMVMTAHIFNRNWDAQYPATLSRSVITGLLRDSLKFDGVVISDDMQMRAITASYGLETAITRAIDAGVDILLFGNNAGTYDESIAPRAAAIIHDRVARGLVTRSRIIQSYRRIMALKQP